MGKGTCSSPAGMNNEARSVKCWACLELFCEGMGLMWFLIAFSFDCGTGWIAAMISIIGYSTFACCQPNDAGLKCMAQTVVVGGIFRFISFCMLCAYLGNIEDWDYSCVATTSVDCYNNPSISYSDGLTNCYHHQ